MATPTRYVSGLRFVTILVLLAFVALGSARPSGKESGVHRSDEAHGDGFEVSDAKTKDDKEASDEEEHIGEKAMAMAIPDWKLAGEVLKEADMVDGQAQCGISGRLSSQGELEELNGGASPEIECRKMLSTNCTLSYHTIRCPEDCPFIQPSATFPCLFSCVSTEECSNRDTPTSQFEKAQHWTRVCEHCEMPNCRSCASGTSCDICYPSFNRSDDGSECVLEVESRLRIKLVVEWIGYILAGIIFTALVWRNCKGRPRFSDQNLFAVHRAMRHRHMTKVQNWHSNKGREMFPLSSNVHIDHVVGSGLALFYNSLVFLMIVAIVCWLISYFVYKLSGIDETMGKLSGIQFLDDMLSKRALEQSTIVVPGSEPAVILSPLKSCSNPSSADISIAIATFARYSFYGSGLMYVILFILSIQYGKFQKKASIAYTARHSTMSDYAVCITGLPKDSTNELVLKEWVQKEISKALGKPETDHNAQVYGVSIGYDYTDIQWEVDCMTTRLIERVEVDSGLYEEECTTAAAEKLALREKMADDAKVVRGWFGEGDDASKSKPMLSSGEVFVIMRHKVGVKNVLKHFDATGAKLCHPSAPDTPLFLSDVKNEPVATCWWHFGVDGAERKRRRCKAGLKLILLIAIVQLAIVKPFADNIMMPYISNGNPAGGAMFTISGLVLGWINMLLCIQIYFTTYDLGFHRKDRRDVLVFWANFLLTLVNTAFQIGITALQAFHASQDVIKKPQTFFEVRSLVRFASENELAHSIFLMLVPGMFFIGNIMCPIMAGVVPYLWNMLLMKVIFVWRCLPDPLLQILRVFLPWAPWDFERYPVRLAEKGLEGMELGLPWDYAGNIIFPTICCSLLPISSPYVWKVFRGLFCWAVFYYFWCRYMHLRFMRAQFYTTRRVDNHVNCAWGLPLSLIAFSCCVWGIRTEFIPVTSAKARVLSSMGAFVASFVLWVFVYRWRVKPFERSDIHIDANDPPVEEVKQETIYTWFNTNPVYTLKCLYLVGELSDRGKWHHPIASGFDNRSVRFFEVGKEYLFLTKDSQDKVEKTVQERFEFETYLDRLIHFLEGPAVKATENFQKILKAKDRVEALSAVDGLRSDLNESFDLTPLSTAYSAVGKAWGAGAEDQAGAQGMKPVVEEEVT